MSDIIKQQKVELERRDYIIKDLEKQLEKITAERDAALRDLHHMDSCDICIGSSTAPKECDCECIDCVLDCRCKNCRNENLWKWRGIQEG